MDASEVAPQRSGRGRIAKGLLLSLVVLGLLELAARLATGGPRWVNPLYVEMSGGFAELESLLEDLEKWPRTPSYYEGFLYAVRPFATDRVVFTDYYSARRTPSSAPLAEAGTIVWTFGGSTMENFETTDSLTIANTWAVELGRALGPVHVKNFGTGGFASAHELVKFQRLLRHVPEDELPGIAVFYDGFNDALFGFQYGPGKMQTDLSLKLQALVEEKNVVLGAYAISRFLSRYSRLWERTGARAVDNALFPFPDPRTDERALAATVRDYVGNVRMADATCRAFGVRCFFILQPLLVTKTPRTEPEQRALDRLEAHPRFGTEGARFVREFYERVRHELSGVDGFIDASRILDGRTESDLYDLGHTSALTSPVIGRETAELMLGRLSEPLPLPPGAR